MLPLEVKEKRWSSFFLTGAVDDYHKMIKAGRLAVDKKRYTGVINDIKVKGQELKMIVPETSDKTLDNKQVDVLVIGGGITGAAILRELTKYNLKSATSRKRKAI